MNPLPPPAPVPAVPAAAWTTAWPVALALGVLLVAAWRGRRDLLRWNRQGWVVVGLLVVGAFVRLAWLPALRGHLYDGHEADYLDLFLGARAPTRGGTVLYPSMQWLWWLLGRIAADERWPVLVSVGAGLASIGLAVALARRWFGPAAATWTGLFLVLYGNHAFWSSSAYNVIIPLMFSLLALWAADRGASEGRFAWTLLGAAAAVLAVATRLESVLLVVPLALILAWRRPRDPLVPLATWAGGGLLALAAVLPLVWHGGMPGTGGRWLSFRMNVGTLDYLAPWDHPWVLLALAIGAARTRPGADRPALVVLGVWASLTHLAMATFDDQGFRHLLPAGVAVAMLVGGALGSLPRVAALALALPVLALEVTDLQELSRRYYAPDTAFQASLPAALPRVPLADRPDCVVVGEDPRLAGDAALSHFNLLDPDEADHLRARTGCLQWCMDLEDWRWSSRGVRDRAIRLHRIYALEPVAVLVEPGSGYACLLHEVGRHRLGQRSDPPLRISSLPPG